MQRCFYLTCDGYKQGHIVSKFAVYGERMVEVIGFDGSKNILKEWKVLEVEF